MTKTSKKFILIAAINKTKLSESFLSLHWKTQPRASKCSKRGCGKSGLSNVCSLILVSPTHAKSAAPSSS